MTDLPDVAHLLFTAQTIADNTDATVDDIGATTVETVSAFEARLQHHFARGPFFVKLRNRLRDQGHIALAQRINDYYLAANVLKHGNGKSLRELEKAAHQPFIIQHEDGKPLIDITADGFLSGLVTTLREAHAHLEPG